MCRLGDFVYSRSCQGQVKGLVLGWSGTLADAYVLAPAVVFVEVFAKHGVGVSMPEEKVQRRPELTREILRKAGARYVIEPMVELPDVIDDVNERLARGDKP